MGELINDFVSRGSGVAPSKLRKASASDFSEWDKCLIEIPSFRLPLLEQGRLKYGDISLAAQRSGPDRWRKGARRMGSGEGFHDFYILCGRLATVTVRRFTKLRRELPFHNYTIFPFKAFA